jgi:phosphoribosylformimino-5-aminoimidazole carboxamide ribotide isomerase
VIAIPAIDLLEGRCVRLYRGSYQEVTEYPDDPSVVAQRFERAGAKRIHLVDLNAARGSGDNRAVLKRIRSAVSCTLEVGGGVRTTEDVEHLFDLGIDFGVVGTRFAQDPESVERWVQRFGHRFVAGVDARNGLVRVRGWEEGTELTACQAVKDAARVGVSAVEYTDITRDGALTGPNIEATVALTECADVPIILSGGVGSESDLIRIRETAPQLYGVILGRALYENRITVERAVEIMEHET